MPTGLKGTQHVVMVPQTQFFTTEHQFLADRCKNESSVLGLRGVKLHERSQSGETSWGARVVVIDKISVSIYSDGVPRLQLNSTQRDVLGLPSGRGALLDGHTVSVDGICKICCSCSTPKFHLLLSADVLSTQHAGVRMTTPCRFCSYTAHAYMSIPLALVPWQCRGCATPP
jgi:hypothetical protein